MKKIIFSLILFIGLNATAQFINVSTGVDNSGNALPAGSVDPNWQIAASPNPPTTPALVSAPFPGAWENTPTSGVNAGWINSTGNPNFTNLPGDYTFERPFTVGIGNTNIDYNLNAAWDDVFIAFEFVRPDGSTIPIAITPNSLSPRYLSTTIPSSLTTTMNGIWKIRGIINFIDGAGGFLMAGTITITTTPCDKWSLCGNTTTVTDFLGTINNQPLNFKTNNTQRMTLDYAGRLSVSNAGISTYQKLYVETNAQNDGIQVNQTGTTAATLDLNASGGAGKRWALHSTGSGNSQGAGHLLFWDWTTNQERMRINEDGKVRIGNMANLPSGYKLFVEEGILTEKVKVAVVNSGAWADYVFANDYNLKPLSEVESFIKENKHLPNIPSATELEKEGLDLGVMQSLQMAKIEELTLYMIEMKKEIEVLKTQISKK